jgi:hypothetical protein
MRQLPPIRSTKLDGESIVAGSGLHFDERGTHDLKGIDQPVALLAATASRGA